MKRILTVLLFCSLGIQCFAGTVSLNKVYGTNDQVTASNLNGNFSSIVNEVNTGLDNDNADTTSGFRFYESLGSRPASATNGRMVYNTADDSLNIDDGTAWDQVPVYPGAVAQGEILQYDGTNWERLGVGTSGQFLKTQGAASDVAWAEPIIQAKVVTFTRTMATATGTQGVTGVGFVPVAVIFLASEANTDTASWGLDDGSAPDVLNTPDNEAAPTAGDFQNNGAAGESIVIVEQDSGRNYTGKISAFGADGFTVSWTRTGAPDGTITISALAIR